jgi:hypothetical protein
MTITNEGQVHDEGEGWGEIGSGCRYEGDANPSMRHPW